MGKAFVALKRGRLARPPAAAAPFLLLGGQGGGAGASPLGCDCGANAAPGLFSVQPGGLEALGPSFGVARSRKTAAGIAASLAP
jgi:hypothetical protein